MTIQSSGAYNNPALGQAAQNIAAMFAPPSAGELAAYSTARANNQKSNIVAQLAADPKYQGFDHQAILADLFDPTQSFTRVQMDDATNRRGQDITAATSRANNADTNRTTLISNMFDTLDQGQIRPALPGDIASAFALPELPQVVGAPKPLTQDQVLGGQTQRLIDDGQLTDANLISTVMGDVPVENIVGPNGRPMTVPRDQAHGAEPYFNPGAEAKPTNGVAVLRDGSRVPAVQDRDGRWRHAQTGEELPSDIQIFATPQAQGTAEEIGMVSKPTGSQIEQQLLDIAVAKDTAVALRDKIAESPASQGAVGWLRGTAQNFIQTGGELGQYFGGDVEAIQERISSGLEDQNLAGAFDTNIPAIELLANLLAFQYAKTTTGERLSNEMLQTTRAALGLDGLTANQASSLARLDQAIAQIESQERILREARTDGVDAIGGARPAPSSGNVLPTPQTQADFDALPPGALYIDPDDGKQYRKP
ncbi:hypothetical protein [Devosia marina]|uniref:Uncharacterized protein n=1 Tax=Devosia marina TaxID=2683198 RepID=A0A7X3FNJ9_9HYPH|nr:hypothetical protein [Devosia marina]MVS97887.1 hypothetical protein [Devosia marina]